jgi:preprotein translocase subunit SecF
MLRTLLLLIALIVVIVMALIWSGYLNLNRQADGSVSIDAKSVEVGTTTTNVQVPVVRTETRQVEVPSVAVTNGQANQQ